MITNDKGRVSRYTDRETIDAMLMAYAGKVNKRWSGSCRQAGVNAVGLSAMDGRIAIGRRKPVIRGIEDGKPKVLRDDHAGTIEQIDITLVQAAARGRLSPGADPAGARDRRGPADQRRWRQTGARARDRPRRRSVALLLRHAGVAARQRRRIDLDPGDRRLRSRNSALAVAKGRMVVKVEAALGAIQRGVGRVVFSDARAEQPVRRSLAGEGTVVRAKVS